MADEVDFDGGLVLDLSEIADAPEREPLRPGTYDCEVVDVEFTSSKAGKPMLKWTFQTTDEEYNNARLWNYTTLDNEVGQRITRDSIQRINPDVDLSAVKLDELAADMVGRPCRIRVKNETYQGTKRNSVAGVLAAEGDGDFLS
jgi:hypothetical protein